MKMLAALVVRARYFVVGGWFLAALASLALLPSFDEARSLGLGSLIPDDAEAIRTELRALQQFRFPVLGRTAIVQRDPDGLSVEAQVRVVQRAIRLNQRSLSDVRAILGAIPITNTLGIFPGSREEGTTALTYLFFDPGAGVPTRVQLAQRLADRYVDKPEDALVGITGPVPARDAQAKLIEGSLPRVEVATVILIAVIVGVTFRSFIAPILTLLASGLAYALSLPMVAWGGRLLGTAAPEEVEPVIVVLLLGIVTDYSIFFLAGARERLRMGASATDAAEWSARQFLGTILTAGFAVAAGGAALLVASLGFLRAFAPSLVITVLVGVLVSATFVPAAIAIAGRRLFWLRSSPSETADGKVRPRPARTGGWTSRIGALSGDRRHAAVVLMISLIALGAAAYQLRKADLGFSLVGALPGDSEPRTAAAAASQGFAPGVLSPTLVVAEGNEIDEQRARLVRLQEMIEAQPGVASVIGPKQQPLTRGLGLILSRSGDAVRYIVILDSAPLSGEGVESINRLKRRMPEILAASGLPQVRVSFAGDTALVQETIARTVSDLWRIGLVVLAVDLILLSIFLRSFVAPFYLLAMSVLGLLATLGLTVVFFQGILGYPGITYYVPIAAAVLLVSLGSDYNIFIAGRIWDEARRRPLMDAIPAGAGRAAEAITIAGITLAGSFALLALVPLRPLRELAFVMATGILVDAFFVRSLLVPAAVALAGRASEWPSHRFFRARSDAGQSQLRTEVIG